MCASHLKENQVLGDYILKKSVGSGAFASVWEAQHKITKTHVGIKIVEKLSIEDADAKTRFNREIFLLKKLKHPFIAELFECFEDPHYHYLVMEFCPKGNLLDFVNDYGKIAEPQARRYFSQLLSVLEYLHFDMKVAHRDLKAENVLLDQNNNIRLIDFGLSNVFTDQNAQLNTACGSPAYAAPEMIKGMKYTKSADVWSAGILLFSMIAGQLPYDDDNVQRLLQKIVYTEVKFPVFFSPALIDLLKKMLTKQPEQRIDIPKIKEHFWFSKNEYDAIVGLRSSDQQVDKEIVDKMTSLKVDTKMVAENVLNNEFNQQMAVYRILSKQKMITQIEKVMKGLVENGPIQASPSQVSPKPSLNAVGVTVKGASNLPARRMSKPIVARRVVETSSPLKSHES